jgi:hypothetical protein
MTIRLTAIASLILFALMLAASLVQSCGPTTCGRAGWLYDFQTLIAGVLAIAAAIIAVGGAWILDRNQYRRRRADEAQAHVAVCVNAATALAPYVMGIQEVAELAVKEAHAADRASFGPLREAILLAEQRCAEGRRAVASVPITLHQKLLSFIAEFEILLFKARIALAYGDSPAASRDIQLEGLEDVVKRAISLYSTMRKWMQDPG